MPLPGRPAFGPTSSPEAMPLIDPATLDAALMQAVAKVRTNLARWAGGFPSSASTQGRYAHYRPDAIVDANAWTGGFWPGLLWLAYEASGDQLFRQAALAYVPLFDERLTQRRWVDHHDLGFLYSLAAVAAYRVSGDEAARALALRAADLMMSRYHPRGRFIQAWGAIEDPTAHRLIIDSLMNLPLLFWAAETTGRPEYGAVAEAHLYTTLAHVIRADGSTLHTFYFDPATGAPSHGVTHQGFSDASCWSRGQAWAMYGLPLAARSVPDPALMIGFQRVADYFLARVPADRVCYWDLVFTAGPQERDSSAAAIAICGLLEAQRHLPPGSPRDRYASAAQQMMQSLISHYRADATADGLLLHGVYSKPHGSGVDECCIWGDYFYLEALLRFKQDWKPYW